MSSDSPPIAASIAASAVVSLGVVSALGLAVGFDPSATLRDTSRSALLHYVVVAGGIGPIVAIGWRRGARITAGGGALAVLGGILTRTPGEIPRSLALLNIGLTASLVLLALAVAVEYGLRNPAALRDVFTPRAAGAGVLAGALHVGAVLVLRPWLGLSTAYLYTLGNVVIAVWSLGGVFLVGLGAGTTAIRYRLVAPSLVVLGAFSWAVYGTWTIRGTLRSGSSLAGAPLSLYGWLWFAVLALALGGGGLELIARGSE